MAQHHIGQSVDAVKFSNQVDTSEEVRFDDLPLGVTVRIATKNSLYEYNIEQEAVRGGVLGGEWVHGFVEGSTFGGSMIAVGRLIPGSLAEIRVPGQGTFTTSPIAAIEVVQA